MEKTRYDLRAGLDFDSGFFESIRASFAQTDYEHDEVEYFEDGVDTRCVWLSHAAFALRKHTR